MPNFHWDKSHDQFLLKPKEGVHKSCKRKTHCFPSLVSKLQGTFLTSALGRLSQFECLPTQRDICNPKTTCLNLITHKIRPKSEQKSASQLQNKFWQCKVIFADWLPVFAFKMFVVKLRIGWFFLHQSFSHWFLCYVLFVRSVLANSWNEYLKPSWV